MSFWMTRIFLIVSGTITLLIGASILLIPHSFFAASHITLGADPNLLSEVRAPGGLLLIAGAGMMAGASAARRASAGLLIAAAVYLSYGSARVMSVFVDGVPAPALVIALCIELALGLIAAGLAARKQLWPAR